MSRPRPVLVLLPLALLVAVGWLPGRSTAHPWDMREDDAPADAPRTPTTAPSVTPQPFTEQESACFAQQKVLYHEDGRCYKLRQQGPCERDDTWLVLDKVEASRPGGALRAVCEPCACCTRVRQVFWPADGQCHRLTDRHKLCPHNGTVLQSDPFGEGECVCNNEPPHARYEPRVLNASDPNAAGVCYPLYHRGPCPRGKILTKSALKGYGSVGVCTQDPCRAENARAGPNTTHALHAGDGRCHPLGGVGGPCAADESFNVHPVSREPTCIRRQNNIFSLPERCQTDASGECQKEVKLSEDDKTLFALELLASADKRKKRRTKNGLD